MAAYFKSEYKVAISKHRVRLALLRMNRGLVDDRLPSGTRPIGRPRRYVGQGPNAVWFDYRHCPLC